MLIIDEKWLLIGPNRHGNTFAKDVLEKGFEGKVRMCVPNKKHWPLCKIDPELRKGKILVGIIRSPVLWYVSKWRRFWDDCEGTPDKRYEFDEYFYRHWQNPHGPIGKNMEDLPLSPAGIGAWSYKHIAYHCLDARDALANLDTQDVLAEAYPELLSVNELMTTETLREDLPRVFGEHIRQHSMTVGIPNPASHSQDAMQYYSPRVLRSIRDGDGWLLSFYLHLRHATEVLES